MGKKNLFGNFILLVGLLLVGGFVVGEGESSFGAWD